MRNSAPEPITRTVKGVSRTISEALKAQRNKYNKKTLYLQWEIEIYPYKI